MASTPEQLFATGLLIVLGFVGLLAVRSTVEAVRAGRELTEVWARDVTPADDVSETGGPSELEVEGTARQLTETIEAEYSGEECVAYSYKRERRSDEEDSWSVIDRGESAVPFCVEDDSGAIAIDPSGANRRFGITADYRDVDRSGPSETRRLENRLEPGDTVHVYGKKHSVTTRDEAEDLDGARMFIGDHEDIPFQINEGSEAGTIARTFLTMVGFVVLAGICGVILFIAVDSGATTALWRMSPFG